MIDTKKFRVTVKDGNKNSSKFFTQYIAEKEEEKSEHKHFKTFKKNIFQGLKKH